MANPTPYTQAYDFSDFASENPSTPLPGDRLDIELAALERTTDETIAALADVRRSDGALKNRIVTRESLSSSLLALTGADTGAWVALTAYVVGDLATFGGRQYQCLIAHTSTVFAVDLAAGKWALTAAESSEDAAEDAAAAAASAAAAAASVALIPAFSAFWMTIVGALSAAASWLLLQVLGHLTTRTLIKALVPSAGMAVFLSEAGREGTFVWRTGDYSTQIAADPAEGVYLKADSVATTVGAWVRADLSDLNAAMFGSMSGADATPAIQAMIDFLAVGGGIGYILRGNYTHTTAINMKSGVTVFCDPGAVLSWLGASGLERAVSLDGTSGSEVDLTTSVTRGDRTLNIANRRSRVVTISNASPGVITWPLHGLVAGDTLTLATTGALPTGLATATTYYVKTVLTTNTFTVSLTNGGAVINTSSAGSGVHTGSAAVSLASQFSLSAGDLVLVKSQRDSLHSDAGSQRLGVATGSGNPCYFAEYGVVSVINSVSSSAVQFVVSAPLIFSSYRADRTAETDTTNARANATLQKITPCLNAHWIGGKFISDGGVTSTFRSKWAWKCSVRDVDIERGTSGGESVYWRAAYECKAEDVRSIGSVTLENDPADHDSWNRFKTASAQSIVFRRCYDYNGSQSFDTSYIGADSDYGRMPSVDITIIDCETKRAVHSGMTSHPGCWNVSVVNCRFLDCLNQGITQRSRGGLISNNTITGTSEGLTDAATDTEHGIGLYAGFARENLVVGNRISGFSRGINIYDSTGEAVFTAIDCIVEANHISRCFYGVYKETVGTNTNSTPTGLVLQGNFYDNIGRYGIRLGSYSPGTIINGETFYGPFIDPVASSTLQCINVQANNPALIVENCVALRFGTGGTTKTFLSVANISDTTTFPSATWAKQSRFENNVIVGGIDVTYSVNNTAFKQQDNDSDVDVSDSYTPTLSNTTNVAGSTASTCYWERISDTVRVWGQVQIQATAATTATLMGMSLPLTSDIGAATDAAGVFATNNASKAGRISGDATNDRVSFQFNPDATTNFTYNFMFAYKLI